MSFNLLEPLDQREKDGLLQYCKDIIDSGYYSSTLYKHVPNNFHTSCMYVCMYVCMYCMHR